MLFIATIHMYNEVQSKCRHVKTKKGFRGAEFCGAVYKYKNNYIGLCIYSAIT